MKALTGSIAMALALSSQASAQEPHRAYDSRPIIVTPDQERAVEQGLAWLADQQGADGAWRAKIGYKLNADYRETGDDAHVGVSALACMAFLAGGNLPGRGKYGPVVEKGLDFVLSCAQADGYITFSGTRMYSHAFATLFLAEIYGMTHRQDVRRKKLQKAVDFIVDTQNEEGGWRYVPFAPGIGHVDRGLPGPGAPARLRATSGSASPRPRSTEPLSTSWTLPSPRTATVASAPTCSPTRSAPSITSAVAGRDPPSRSPQPA